MEQMQLTPRLRAVAELVPAGARLADVGTDHAHLPAWLLLQGKIPSAIASDLRPGPLERAAATVTACGLQHRVSLRLCSGLAAIQPEEVDAVTICGMGGEVMRSILEAAPWTKHRTLILQPQSNQPKLRRFLGEQGYQVLLETVVREEQRWYPILVVQGEGARRDVPPEEALMGDPAVWRKEPLRRDYLTFLLEKCQRERQAMLSSLKSAESPRAAELAQCIAALERERTRLEAEP